MEQIGGIVNDLVKNLNKQQNTQKQFIFDALMEQLDEKEKKHVCPHDIIKKNLILLADSTGWMYTLNLKKNQLLARLQEKFGRDEIEGIKFRIG